MEDNNNMTTYVLEADTEEVLDPDTEDAVLDPVMEVDCGLEEMGNEGLDA